MRITIADGGETQILHRPRHKDIDEQQVVELRRMLTAAGYRVDERRED